MKMIASLLFVFAVASSVLGECPVPPTVPGADIGKIAGRWYQNVTVLPHHFTTITWDFIPREDGNFNLTIHPPTSYGSKVSEDILAERTDNQNVLLIRGDAKKYQYTITFNIADVDYDSYIDAYICFTLPPRSFIKTRPFLSRTSSMNADRLIG